MEQRKRLLGFLEEAEDDKAGSKPSSGGENTNGQEEQMSPEDAEKQFLQNKVKEFQQKKEQEEKIADDEKQKTIDRFNKVHSKLGRLLATPEEIYKLDKEREEKEKQEAEKNKKEKTTNRRHVEPEDEYTYYDNDDHLYDEFDIDDEEEDNELDEGKVGKVGKVGEGGQYFDSLEDVRNKVNVKKIQDKTIYYIGVGDNKQKMTGKQVKDALLQQDKGNKGNNGNGQPPPTKANKKAAIEQGQEAAKKELAAQPQNKTEVKPKAKKGKGKRVKYTAFDTDYAGRETQGEDFDSAVRKIAWGLNIVAPGTATSTGNETGTGYLVTVLLNDLSKKSKKKDFYDKNNNADISKLTETLQKELKKTPLGKKIISQGKEKKLEEVCRAAALSAASEAMRVKKVLKEKKLNLNDVEISCVWGSQESKNNACGALRENGVTDVNGYDVETYAKNDGVIQSGGGGDDSTDTMIVIIPKKAKKGKKEAIVLHTSNKMGTGNIISNSSIEKNVEKIMGMIEGKKKKEVQPLADKLVNKLKQKNNEIKKAVGEVIPEYNDDVITQIKNEGKNKDKWDEICAKWNPPNGTAPKDKDKKARTKKEMEIYNKWRDHVIEESVKDPDADGKVKLSEVDKRIMGMFAKSNPKSLAKVNGLYHEQFKEYNKFRKDLNEKLGNKEGDRLFAVLFFHRMHITGGDAGGVPSSRFETNMGQNETSIKFDDKTGKPVKKIDGKWHYIDENGTKGEKFERNENELSQNPKHATVINNTVLEGIYGRKIPLDNKFYDGITVDNVTFDDEGNVGTAIIYMMVRGKKVKLTIGSETIRSKSGFAGKPQDTVQYSKEFQELLVLQSWALHKKNVSYLKEENASLRIYFETYELVEDD